ncbi:vacuolar protein sorting-associated protein 33B isoform X2 [Nematostella vectensis]|uniref:vacuolar protein sorting-associated protein 33B isoform X2 n=1 Tax=Nematostella vectensis TaxID=45351 RepID=UPI002076FBA5|nr:vacuolar protein sorting-associated protein 33B isoform X2 [Nematostella vectensis]
MAASGGPDFGFVKNIVKDKLIDILESVPGKKDLVIDPKLMKPLDHIAGAAFLKEHGVDKIFKLDYEKITLGCDKRIYLLRPRMVLTKYVADHINHDKRSHTSRQYKIVFAPRKMVVCEMVLEQEGVYGDCILDEFEFEIIPIDKDLLSMELPEFFNDFFLDGDQGWIYTIAHALMTLQKMYGTIPQVYGLGRSAKMVIDTLKDLLDEEGEYKPVDGPEIDSLILIDRDVDYVTPLCSQVTYHGLLDDTFSTRSGFIEFGPEVTGKEQPLKMLLGSQDEVFCDIRDRHFSNVFTYLRQKAISLQSGYDKRHNLSSVSDMKNFVSTELSALRQQHKSLALHIGACEVVLKKKAHEDFEKQLHTEHELLELVDNKETIDYLEQYLMRQFPSVNGLRLLCLLSLTHGGIDPKLYKTLKTHYLHSYGFEHMVTFGNLRQLGLFTETDKKNTFKVVSKKMNLVPRSGETINLKEPTNMAYVFSGAYTPLTCKLVEQIQVSGLSAIDDVTRVMGVEVSSMRRAASARANHQQAPPKTTMVMFLGGCTYTEITALRFLGKQRGCQFIVGTTAITNSTRLLNSLIQAR